MVFFKTNGHGLKAPMHNKFKSSLCLDAMPISASEPKITDRTTDPVMASMACFASRLGFDQNGAIDSHSGSKPGYYFWMMSTLG
ncbi:MAG: hypothetical protein QM527_04570 [Alphaproteobacteria bacterium]|nr:hypothetical protein [Alphaproteobacteria bacterium]